MESVFDILFFELVGEIEKGSLIVGVLIELKVWFGRVMKNGGIIDD